MSLANRIAILFILVVTGIGCNKTSSVSPLVPHNGENTNLPSSTLQVYWEFSNNSYKVSIVPGSFSVFTCKNTFPNPGQCFTATLAQDVVLPNLPELWLQLPDGTSITGEISGFFEPKGSNTSPGYHVDLMHLKDNQLLNFKDGSSIILSKGILNYGNSEPIQIPYGIFGIALPGSKVRINGLSDNLIGADGAISFVTSHDGALNVNSLSLANDTILRSCEYFYNVKSKSQVNINPYGGWCGSCFDGPIQIAPSSKETIQENPLFLPVISGMYHFKSCYPSTPVNFSEPFFINSGISISSIRLFDKSGVANEGIVSSNVDRFSIADDRFEFKLLPSSEIKFKVVHEVNNKIAFSIKEFEIARQRINFHYNWTDTTPGSTTPKPIDVPVALEGIVSLYGWQPSFTTIVEYNPNMLWSGHWTNGTNTYVGVPWKKNPNAQESKNFKYCLVQINFGSGLGGERDPDIEAFGLSPGFADSPEDAKRYCGNDLATMNTIYQRALKEVPH